jgi:hypothetical protein
MSISAMKYALDVLDNYVEDPRCETHRATAVHFLEQAIAEAEKTMYVDSSRFYKDSPEHKPGMVIVEPVHAIDMSQECVDKTAKHRHEPVAWREVAGKTTHYYDYNEEGRGEPLYAAPPKREWVGLTDDEIWDCYTSQGKQFYLAIEAKLKEKNA